MCSVRVVCELTSKHTFSHTPGLNVIRQDLLVHVPSGKIIICEKRRLFLSVFKFTEHHLQTNKNTQQKHKAVSGWGKGAVTLPEATPLGNEPCV